MGIKNLSVNELGEHVVQALDALNRLLVEMHQRGCKIDMKLGRTERVAFADVPGQSEPRLISVAVEQTNVFEYDAYNNPLGDPTEPADVGTVEPAVA